MKKFIVNKYPIRAWTSEGNHEIILEVGTIFTIEAMNGVGFELRPVVEIKGVDGPFSFDCAVIEKGFHEQDCID